MIDRKRIETEFKNYVEHYDLNDVKVFLKYEHTYYVANHCERIAKALGLSEEEVDLAWTIGMFHDIGRFEQLRIYHTFKDNESINHAALSADILFKDGFINQFLDDYTENKQLIEYAVRFHNLYRLPEYLSERERMFSDILRDADKIDILRVNCETPRTEIYDLPESAFTESAMSKEIYEAMISHQEINRKYSKTGIDYIMGHIGFVYGLVFDESKRIVKEQGYLAQLLDFESNHPITKKQLIQIKQVIEQYLAIK